AVIDTTSHVSELLNCGQTWSVEGKGISQYANQARPRCRIGMMPAISSAARAIASARRLSEERHGCAVSSSAAERNVPAWPMPIHQTKLMIGKPHAVGMSLPHRPTPVVKLHA